MTGFHGMACGLFLLFTNAKMWINWWQKSFAIFLTGVSSSHKIKAVNYKIIYCLILPLPLILTVFIN
jgi:hypothetical protein